jgi:hypothetical protein
MVKYWSIVALLVFFSCNGTLSDEQRKKIKEEMERGKIQKVSDVQITEQAFVTGREIAGQINGSSVLDRDLINTLQKKYKVKIARLQTGDSLLLEIEQMIVEAYIEGKDSVNLTDNVQKVGDTLLFTRPVMKKRPDGTVEFDYALGIRMPRKQIILSIDQ